jgi:hypothetical protein
MPKKFKGQQLFFFRKKYLYTLICTVRQTLQDGSLGVAHFYEDGSFRIIYFYEENFQKVVTGSKERPGTFFFYGD